MAWFATSPTTTHPTAGRDVSLPNPDPRNGFTFTLINIHTDPTWCQPNGALVDILHGVKHSPMR
jgi:hypothetical protein